MKKQVTRLSPHQNGKVFGVLMALGTLIVIVPFSVIAMFSRSDPGGPPVWLMFTLFPVLYLVFGYLSVAAGCWLYNVMFRHIGGIEYEAQDGQG